MSVCASVPTCVCMGARSRVTKERTLFHVSYFLIYVLLNMGWGEGTEGEWAFDLFLTLIIIA